MRQTDEIPKECEFCKEPPTCFATQSNFLIKIERWLCCKHKKMFLNTFKSLRRLDYEEKRLLRM